MALVMDARPAGDSGKGQVHQEDALRFLVDSISADIQVFKKYGYDLYATHAAERYAIQVEGFRDSSSAQGRMYEISTVFFDAAWELCRRGIIRPGIRTWGEQATDDGSAGNGFSVTPYGRRWLQSEERHLSVPTEPERFGVLLAKYSVRFGAGFQQRSQEALRCYGANAHLAACVMCGAAAESILLSVAIKKANEGDVLKMYRASNGRRQVENLILQGKDDLRAELLGRLALLKYWRDDASHGTVTSISNEEAFVALATLLRLAQFVDDNWDRFVA